MTLTTEERVEIMRRARQAKANKKLTEEPVVNVEPPTPKVKKIRKKNEVAPLPEPVQLIEEDDEEEEEVVEVPIPAPKKKTTVNKFSKLPKIEPQKCCDEIVSHEQPLITDDKPQVVDKIVIPSKNQITKPKKPRASAPVRTLDITEPAPITELINDLEEADMKYRPKQVKPPPTPSAPIKITYKDPPLQLFHY